MGNIYYTSCPKDFDYEETIELDTQFCVWEDRVRKQDKFLRAVSIPWQIVDSQVRRYESDKTELTFPRSELNYVIDRLHLR